MFSRNGPVGRSALIAPLALMVASCTDAPGAPAEPTRAAGQHQISDQLHSSGTQGFVFLPPMVPRPAIFGDFLPDLEPVVRIDEVRPDGTTIRTLATFTRDSGPSRERIRVHRQGEPCDRDDDDGDDDPNGYFYARWFTNNAHLSNSAIYRVRVFVQDRVHPCTRNGRGRRCRHGEDNTAALREIGFADVDVVRNSREARAVDRAEFVPLVNGHVLRIKFRIDRPVVDPDGDHVYTWRDNCPTVANPNQLDTNNDSTGDACECLGVTCTASDACHAAGTCSPTDGSCSNPSAPDGTVCALANASATCTAGACGVASCNALYANCDGNTGNGCETATNTVTNCGACGVACTVGANASPTCGTGTCALQCDAGWADCDGNLTNGCEQNVATDENHCGACGNVCTQGRTCANGGCTAAACTGGLANCDGVEDNGCEVTPATDVNHCGACAHACALANATPACTGGACQVEACTSGFLDCNAVPADGCEVNGQNNVANCGACGHACALANANPVCAGGHCAVGSCASGFANVDGNPANGCEVNLATDVNHCGTVGSACGVPNGTAACSGGTCVVAGCDGGYGDCDGNAANGCEVAITESVSHCGTCGNVCVSGANSDPSCSSGTCGLRCQTGYTDCDGNPTNGCEVHTDADGANCGACGNACTQGRTCQSGACTAATCTGGLGNCDGNETNGCEVTLASTVQHCGACGNTCSFANAAAECTASACGFSVCNNGFGDCDAIATNGCEVDLSSNNAHCGGCGVACGVGQACTTGVCVSTCAPRTGGIVSLPGAAYGLDVVGTKTYVAMGAAGLAVIDTACGAPRLVGTVALPTIAGRPAAFAYDVRVPTTGLFDGNYAFVVAGTATYMVNITNPAAPTVVHSYGGRATDDLRAIATGRTYTATTNPCCTAVFNNAALLSLAGASNSVPVHAWLPGNPYNVPPMLDPFNGGTNFTFDAQSLAMANDNFVFGAYGNQGIVSYYVGAANHWFGPGGSGTPVRVTLPGYSHDIALAAGRAFVSGTTGLHVLDYAISSSASWSLTLRSSTAVAGGTAYGVWSDGTTAAVAVNGVGVRYYDVTNPAAPVLTHTLASVGENWRVRVADGYTQITQRAQSQLVVAATPVPDPCEPNPCQNGGTCTANGASYTCACLPGMTGANCQTNTTGACVPAASTVTAGRCGLSTSKCWFLSSCAYTGAQLGGLAGADAWCQAHARAAGLQGTFRAWLSTGSVSAASRLTHATVPYRNMNGGQIVPNWSSLVNDGSLNAPGSGGEPAYTQANVPMGQYVWTNTNIFGASNASNDCGGWTSNSGAALVGHSHYVDGGRYTSITSQACATPGALYCLEQ